MLRKLNGTLFYLRESSALMEEINIRHWWGDRGPTLPDGMYGEIKDRNKSAQLGLKAVIETHELRKHPLKDIKKEGGQQFRATRLTEWYNSTSPAFWR